ncbi:MAG: multidrug transporter [Rhodothalassiaceae bacterium]|nr:MAG: multidrug transporter [Rhodothalassiaceae bacterium]
MLISDIAVKRPVFATVVSLLLVVFGIVSFTRLPVRELPNIDPPIVSVRTDYPGASAAVVETRITQVIEDQVAGIQGIKSISSTSEDGSSNVVIEFTLSRDIDAAANDVRDRVSRVLDRLPEEADPPEIAKVDSDTRPIMWFSLSSPAMDVPALTDFAERNIVDRLSVVEGVARVQIGGQQRYAMRIYLDRQAMAARALTVADVEAALRSENVELPGGSLESRARNLIVRIERGYNRPEDFAQLVIARGADGHLVRLGEIARVEIGPFNDKTAFRGNGVPRVGIGIVRQSNANDLAVARAVHQAVERIRETLPEGVTLEESFDSTIFISAAIAEVYKTLFIAMGLVVLVLYLFLGSVRTVLVPAVTVPVSIIAAFTVMAAFGLSINLLTLLALVLAIGLVVDDAIVVLENIYRRVEEGEPRLHAAFHGTRQVGFAVIATTLVLIAVFVPIAFLQGNVGRLFAELGIAMAAAVGFSSLVALTLTPVMCARMLVREGPKPRFNRWLDRQFARLKRGYEAVLVDLMDRRLLVFGLFLALFALIAGLIRVLPQELTPREDRGSFFISLRGPEGAGFDYMRKWVQEIEKRTMYLVNETHEARVVITRTDGDNTAFGIVVLEPWHQRKRSAEEIIDELRRRYADVTGLDAFVVMPQAIARGRGSPVEFVIGGDTYEDLARFKAILAEEVRRIPQIVEPDFDYRETQPQLRVRVDRDRAADLGVSVAVIGRTLETLLGGRRVTTFIDRGEEYDVLLRAEDADRQVPSDLANIYVRSARTGALVPLSSVVKMVEEAGPATLNRYNRVRALTLSAQLAPGATLGEALAALEKVVRERIPDAVSIDYKGESREFKEAGGAVAFTFAMAFLVVYLVLAAQFESFIHPFVIMLTVPMAAAGGLLALYLGGSTLNIYSQVGLIMLIGLAAKNGILLVEFANQLRDQGRDVRPAMIEAAGIRLRPILMTSFSTVMGAVPLILATGPGSASRLTIGLVIFGGVFLSTFLTLLVIPVIYDLLAPFTRSPGYEAARLARQERELAAKAHGAHPAE